MKLHSILRRIVRQIVGRKARILYRRLVEKRTKRFKIEENSAWRQSDKHLVEYLQLEPHPLNPLSIFLDQWSSKFPTPFVDIGPGPHTLFEDLRIEKMFSYLGDTKNYKVLELGPLEGGHSYMLSPRVDRVVSVEANRNAFLKCLIVKNLFDLHNVEFLYGDFTKMSPHEKFDLIVAVGVLYHMEDPIKLIELLSQKSDRIFFWTHYYEPNLNLWNQKLLQSERWEFGRTQVIEGAIARNVRVVRYKYNEALGWAGFCGGPGLGSSWIYKDDFLKILTDLGFDLLEISFDTPDHANGPAFCVWAERTKTS